MDVIIVPYSNPDAAWAHPVSKKASGNSNDEGTTLVKVEKLQ